MTQEEINRAEDANLVLRCRHWNLLADLIANKEVPLS